MRIALSRWFAVLALFILTGCGAPAAAVTASTASAPSSTLSQSASTSTSSIHSSTASPTTSQTVASSPATTSSPITPGAATAIASSTRSTIASTAAATTLKEATAFPITVKDDAGVAVTIAKRPARIVSLSPSATEIIYAVGAGPDLVAGTQYDNYPPQAKKTAVIKGLQPTLEAIVAYNPDLVIADSVNSLSTVDHLRSLKIPVLFLNAHTLTDVYHDITVVGEAVGDSPQALAVVQHMRGEERQIEAKMATARTHPRVFVEIDATDPAKIYTAGPGSFIDSLVTLAGGVNVAHNAKTAYPQYDLEALLAARERLSISWLSSNINNNKIRPASVL
ncbi:MAG: helical backbone metal receptor, partial [Chloroflexi bacterium]|nr:helical backbone metal receptor [Chloroflexota bacterium]